jgi:hypothetical protein
MAYYLHSCADGAPCYYLDDGYFCDGVDIPLFYISGEDGQPFLAPRVSLKAELRWDPETQQEIWVLVKPGGELAVDMVFASKADAELYRDRDTIREPEWFQEELSAAPSSR